VSEEKQGSPNYNIGIVVAAVILAIVLVLISVSTIGASYVTNFPLEENGGLAVNIQDQTSPAFDIFFTLDDTATFTTLLNNGIKNSYEINITNTTGYSVDDYFGIFEGSFLYSGVILAINGNTLTLDTPLDYNFTTSAIVGVTNREMNVDGSTDVKIFGLALPGSANISIDVTRVMFKMTCTTPPEFTDFCDIENGLTRGIVLRRTDGINQNYFNVKNNGELAHLMFDFNLYDQTKQQGVNGITGRFTFGGQAKHGVVVRLNPGDSLDMLVQDDLRALIEFRIIAEGHVVTD